MAAKKPSSAKTKAKAKAKRPQRRNGRKTQAETLTRRNAVGKLIIQGLSPAQIADTFNVKADVIYKDSRAIYKAWADRAAIDWGLHVAEQLARIEMVEREAWRAWERSIAPRVTTERIYRDVRLDDGQEVKEVYDLKERSDQLGGNPQWLQVLLKCVRERALLLGLGRKEDEATDVDDVPIVAVVVESHGDVERINTVQQVLRVNHLDGAEIVTN